MGVKEVEQRLLIPQQLTHGTHCRHPQALIAGLDERLDPVHHAQLEQARQAGIVGLGNGRDALQGLPPHDGVKRCHARQQYTLQVHAARVLAQCGAQQAQREGLDVVLCIAQLLHRHRHELHA